MILDLWGEASGPYTHYYLPYQLAIAFASTLFFAIVLFLRPIVKTYVIIVSLALVFSVYAVEIYIRLIPIADASLIDTEATAQSGVEGTLTRGEQSRIDSNKRIVELQSLRDKGIDAWPSISALSWVMGNRDDIHTDFLPLGAISSVTTVFCFQRENELIYQSDEHGFHNPEGVWNYREIDVLAIGGSYTEGACVRSEDNMVEHIRQVYPKTVNIGKGGNGSLINFASLAEYGPHLRPKIVLWFFTDNDLNTWESLITIANRYLDESDFRQNLIERQSEIDERWRSLVLEVESGKSGRGPALYNEPLWRTILLLRNFRERLGITSVGNWLAERVQVTKRAVTAARNLTRGWGGRLVFVYLTYNQNFMGNTAQGVRVSKRKYEAVMEAVSGLGVTVIDMVPIFEGHPAPGNLFPAPWLRSHCSPEGYALVAREVLPVIGRMLSDVPEQDVGNADSAAPAQ